MATKKLVNVIYISSELIAVIIIQVFLIIWRIYCKQFDKMMVEIVILPVLIILE